MELVLPCRSLIILCGTAGCGKSTFASSHFKPSEIVSSDGCRAVISDDEGNMESSADAFQLFYLIIEKRMKYGRIVVADSTALSYESRKKLIAIGRRRDYYIVLVGFDIPLETCVERNLKRERKVPERVIRRQYDDFTRAAEHFEREDYDSMVMVNADNIGSVEFAVPRPGMRINDEGPFDIIADVHGCCSELKLLLQKLGYRTGGRRIAHPEGRKAVFAGDIVDRGPRIIDTVNLVSAMVSEGSAYYVPGNHCNKFYRLLKSRKVQVKHGLEMTVDQYDALPKAGREELKAVFMRLYESAPPYMILDGGRLVVAHAGIEEDMIGSTSEEVLDFVLYGMVTGGHDQRGLPERGDWAAGYRGDALIVYGHTPVENSEFVNNTINIDEGVSIGGKLACLRYPERELVSVDALDTYYFAGRERKKHR